VPRSNDSGRFVLANIEFLTRNLNFACELADERNVEGIEALLRQGRSEEVRDRLCDFFNGQAR
jgi:hypothetical protein